jgi:hypothetical protein
VVVVPYAEDIAKKERMNYSFRNLVEMKEKEARESDQPAAVMGKAKEGAAQQPSNIRIDVRGRRSKRRNRFPSFGHQDDGCEVPRLTKPKSTA